MVYLCINKYLKKICCIVVVLMLALETASCQPIETESTALVSSASSEEETNVSENGTPSYNALMPVIVANLIWPHKTQVLERLSEMIESETGIHVTLIAVDIQNAYNDTMNRLYAGTAFDIAFTDDERCDITALYDSGFLVDLMDVKEELKEAFSVLGSDTIDASMMEGRLLSLPCQRFHANAFGFVMRTDLLEEAGFSDHDIEAGSLEKLSMILDRVDALHPEIRLIDEDGPHYQDQDDIFGMNLKHTDPLGDGMGVLDHYGQTNVVTNYYESRFFSDAVTYLSEWGKAGYMDYPANQSYDPYASFVEKMRSGTVFGGFRQITPETVMKLSASCSREMTVFPVTEYLYTPTYGRGYGIPKTSKDPVMAARLLNYIFSSASFNDTLNWGIEGMDWVPIDENTAAFPEGMTKENTGWHNDLGDLYPNQRIGHVFSGMDPKVFYELWPDAENNAHKSIALGFSFDPEGFENVKTALENIRFMHLYVFNGLDKSRNIEKDIDAFNKELYNAGLSDYMNEKQLQMDEWLWNKDG